MTTRNWISSLTTEPYSYTLVKFSIDFSIFNFSISLLNISISIYFYFSDLFFPSEFHVEKQAQR